ncbi:nickel-dependent hydrogenase large subunit [Halochromatium glycolicum]|uniref:HupV protein n=1 Tax=Halochromatium glycolicum TaxID=85075 RepID=A0AAJ0U224_9GAMM|nr:HupV protein [Halochromatium glycolicum]
MKTLVLGPFNRVEGDLEVRLEIADGRVASARVRSPLYRGFEQILHGKEPLDALVIVPRVCGICSVSQSVAAARALADLGDVPMPRNGALATDLVLACENLADHLSHFYLFFMPDFARPVYAGEPWHPMIERRFRALTGTASRALIRARAELLQLMGTLAGKWPHSLSLQPGGSTKPLQPQERLRLITILATVRDFLEQQTFGDRLEAVVALEGERELAAWARSAPVEQGDLRRFLAVSDALGLDRLGPGPGRLMSVGSFRRARDATGAAGFRAGLWSDGQVRALDLTQVSEDLSASWMRGGEPLHPSRGVTTPDADKPGAYSWCKAPRLAGQPVEVGAVARQQIDGQPIIRDLVTRDGTNVHNRVLARLLESARLLIAMESWVRELEPGRPFCEPTELPAEGEGVGLTEAARGSLGHWLQVRHGRLLNYQIIAPTTWNFSPRDAQDTPGPLEQALVGAPVRPGEHTAIAAQHIVRSFDPCMACTVH